MENTTNKLFEVVDRSAKDSFPSIFKADPPSLLYHYASFESCQKILDGNSIKFTHVRFMNDREEMRYGLTMFYELLRAMLKNENDESIRYFLLVLFCSIVATFENERERNGLFSWLEENGFDKDNPEQYAVFKEGPPKDFYVACFSAEDAKDSLPMWHMYAAHGTGVCLGFDAKNLIEAHRRKYEAFPGPFHTSCFYGPEGTGKIPEFKRGIANFIREISNFLKHHYSNGGTKEGLNEGGFLELAENYIIVAALSFKNGAYSHESEWRLFTLVPRDNITHVRFDESKLPYMVPYVLMPYDALAKDLVRKIWLAPAHPNEVETAKTFFSQKSGKPIEVIKSRIPFRNV
jgi:Protein of unknown function (DUF2971)